MSTPPTPESMERGGKKGDEEKAEEPSILPMTPESKQLAAVIATAVATAMAGKSAPPDSKSSMVRYSAGVSLASRTRSIIGIVRNLKLHLVTLPGANLASNELLLKLCKAYFALRRRHLHQAARAGHLSSSLECFERLQELRSASGGRTDSFHRHHAPENF